jgi:hypothetical protein
MIGDIGFIVKNKVMDREIKFRQLWECQNGHKRWAYFTLPDYRDFGRSYVDEEMKLTWGDRNCDCPIAEIEQGYHPISDFQQFIGMYTAEDYNEQEIYEQDIVFNHHVDNKRAGLVVFSNDHHSYILDYPRRPSDVREIWDDMHGKEHCYEVIGNILENPELLK